MKKNNSKKRFFPKINFSWKKKDNRIDNSTILINGILLTCILLSIASGFIDLTFFSGLSKSLFHVGTVPIPASILYTAISIGFIFSKFWCAINLGMIRELQTRLESKGYEWASALKKARIPWHIAHKFLIAVSIITALSLSVNSIGSGIRTMEQNINNMSYDANQLILLQDSLRLSNTEKREAAKDNIVGARTAQETAQAEVQRYATRLKSYQEQYFNISDDDTLSDEDKAARQNEIISRIVAEIPGATRRNAIYFTEADLRRSIQNVSRSNEVVDSTSIYEEGIAYDEGQIEDTIRALADKQYRTPDGELIKFTDDNGSLINVQLAISRLQQGIAKWQSDTGDVGESSKIFTLIATYMNADVKAGGMGTSEVMMMVLIAIFGIVQEFLIYLFTPKANIDRKLLSQVSHYMKWKDESEKERFLISVYISYVGDGVMNQDQFELKCKKAVYFMELTENDVIDKYTSKKPKIEAPAPQRKIIAEKPEQKIFDNKPAIPQGYSDAVARKIKEVEEI